MRESWGIPAPVTLDNRQQRVAARLETACSSKLKVLPSNPSSGAPIYRVVRNEHEHGRKTEGMNWPAPGEKPVVRITIQDDTAGAKSTTQLWASEKEAKIATGVWMWWTDGSRSDNSRVGAAAVCKHGNECRFHCSFLGTRRMEVIDAKLWAIGLVLDVAVKNIETLQMHGVKTVAVFSDSQAIIRRAALLESGPGQRLARQINGRARSLPAHGIAMEIHCVPGHSSIPANEEADSQANFTRDASERTLV
jgi:ribonuclease HI